MYIERVTALKKWILIFAAVIICFCGYTAAAYVKAMQPKKDASREAFKQAEKEAGLVEMTSFSLYSGEESYSVVEGKTADGTQKTVWIPDQSKRKIVVKNSKEGKTEKEIRKIVDEQRSPAEIISIKPGMEKQVALWEVTYLDDAGRYNYDYYEYQTGEWLKYYRSI